MPFCLFTEDFQPLTVFQIPLVVDSFVEEKRELQVAEMSIDEKLDHFTSRNPEFSEMLKEYKEKVIFVDAAVSILI